MPPPTGPDCFCVVCLFRLLIQSAARDFLRNLLRCRLLEDEAIRVQRAEIRDRWTSFWVFFVFFFASES